jgi:hypothetical protein
VPQGEPGDGVGAQAVLRMASSSTVTPLAVSLMPLAPASWPEKSRVVSVMPSPRTVTPATASESSLVRVKVPAARQMVCPSVASMKAP